MWEPSLLFPHLGEKGGVDLTRPRHFTPSCEKGRTGAAVVKNSTLAWDLIPFSSVVLVSVGSNLILYPNPQPEFQPREFQKVSRSMFGLKTRHISVGPNGPKDMKFK